MSLLKACVNYFKALNKLQIIVFTCYLSKEYAINQSFYEKKMHKARTRLLRAMKKIRHVEKKDTAVNLAKLENLYEIIFSLNTLKLRVTDHATFEVCEMEFKKLSECLTNALNHINLFLEKEKHPERHMLGDTAKVLGRLSHQTDALEELYRSTLQVVAKDPIFFLFFIQDLMAFRDELESFILELFNGKSIKNK